MQFFLKFSVYLKFFIIKCFGGKKAIKSSSTQSGLISLFLKDHRVPRPLSHHSLKIIVEPPSRRRSSQPTQSLYSLFQTLPTPGSLEPHSTHSGNLPLLPGPNGNQALPWDTASCSRGSYIFSYIPSTSELGGVGWGVGFPHSPWLLQSHLSSFLPWKL